MPLLTQSNPKYRRHRASGQAVVTIHGRDHYLGPWNTKASKAEYDRIIGEFLANGRQTVLDATNITVLELIDRYWTFAKGYYRRPDNTATSEGHCIKLALSHVHRLYGSTLARDFGPLALECCRNAMIQEGWARGSINIHVGRIKRMVKWGVAAELIPPSVHHGLSAVAGLRAGRSDAKESEPVKPVDDDVVSATLRHLSTVVRAMVEVQRLTGARPGEIAAMRTVDIDTSGPTWRYKPQSHKTQCHGHDREIFIGPKAQSVIRPFLKPLNPTAHLFRPVDAVAEHQERLATARQTPMSCGNVPGSNRVRKPRRKPGDAYSVNSYRRAIARAADDADLWAKGGQVIANDERIVPRWHP
ncbi:MAG: site-specific integrase, partial [Tepidisphaeraceae bacterium]